MTENRPSLVGVTVRSTCLVASFVTVTVVPGTTAPCASFTDPEIAPDCPVWENAMPAKSSRTNKNPADRRYTRVIAPPKVKFRGQESYWFADGKSTLYLSQGIAMSPSDTSPARSESPGLGQSIPARERCRITAENWSFFLSHAPLHRRH